MLLTLPWKEVGVTVDVPLVLDSYVNVASPWLCNKKRGFSLHDFLWIELWTTWKLRNDIFFGRAVWSGLQMMRQRLLRLLKRWLSLRRKKDMRYPGAGQMPQDHGDQGEGMSPARLGSA